MFLELNLFNQNRDYKYHPVSLHDPDARNEILDILDPDSNVGNDIRIDIHNTTNIPNAKNAKANDLTLDSTISENAYNRLNATYIHNKKFGRLQNDLFHSIIMHLSTNELTNCLAVSKYWNRKLAQFQKVTKILQYNRFCVRGTWKSPIDYSPQIISRLNIFPIISPNPTQKLKEFNSYNLWLETRDEDKLTFNNHYLPLGISCLSLIGAILHRPLKTQGNSLCLSIFNTTSCEFSMGQGFDAFIHNNPQINQTSISTLTLIEKNHISSFMNYHSLTMFVHCVDCVFTLSSCCLWRGMDLEVNALLPIDYSRYQNLHFIESFMVVLLPHIIGELACPFKNMDDFTVAAFYLTNIYNLSCYIHCYRPFLVRKLKGNASEKIEKIQNIFQQMRNNCYYKHRLIKRLANNGLTKIKSIFQSFGSFFARISAPHVHVN